MGGLALASLIICSVSLLRLFSLGLSDVGWLTLLLLLTLGAGALRLLFSTERDSLNPYSLSPAFIFLTALLYGPGPASLVALVEALQAFRKLPARRALFGISSAVASTFIAALLFELTLRFAGDVTQAGENRTITLGDLVLPFGVIAAAQHLLRDAAQRAYSALDRGEEPLDSSSPTGFAWCLMAQTAGAAAAALFLLTLQGQGVINVFLGFLIVLHAFWLYRFNEQRVEEVRLAEAAKREHLSEIANLHMNTIESLAIAIDAKDQTTHGHVRRTQVYAMELGKLLGVSGGDLEALRAGALLHDIGKLAVPEYILNKPGKLTAAEFEKMKVHTLVGGDIIRRVNFPYPVEDIVRYHHEKWDGSGYPRGLRGEEIPLVARVISVVDFYDATRCDRPYRIGMKREESLALLRRMAGSSFDPRVVEKFVEHIDYFDSLINTQDIEEQVSSKEPAGMTGARPDAGLAPDTLGTTDGSSGFRSIAEAQREVFALHEIAQTIGVSLNLLDTVTLVASKLRAIVPFDTCVIYLVDEKTGKAQAAHVAGEHAEAFANRRVTIGEGITGWVVANARSMCNTSPELDLVGLPEEVASNIRGVLVSPLVREDGAFGAIALYSSSRPSYTTEHVRLLESVAHHASSALNNAMIYERTKESALTDALTGLPNSRALHLMLEQRLAECQRLKREPLSVLTMDLDDFKDVNDTYGHGVGDRVLAGAAEIIKKQLRQMDVLARFAGDEFVAVMPMASAEVAVRVAERVRAAVESKRFPVRTGRSIQLRISIGIVSFPADGETAEQILFAADRDMHRNKHARKLELQPANLATIEALR